MPTNGEVSWAKSVIDEGAVPIDLVATPVNNLVYFWDIYEHEPLPSETHPYGGGLPLIVFSVLSFFLSSRYLLKKYQKMRTREEESDLYRFYRLYEQLYSEKERTENQHLLIAALYYNDALPLFFRWLRRLRGGKYKKEVWAKLEDSSVSDLHREILERLVAFRNEREAAAEREASGSSKTQNMDDWLRDHCKSLKEQVEPFNQQKLSLDEASHRKLLSKLVVLFNKCNPKPKKEEIASLQSEHDTLLEEKITELFNREGDHRLSIDAVMNALHTQDCELLKKNMERLFYNKVPASHTAHIAKHIDNLCSLYRDSFEKMKVLFNGPAVEMPATTVSQLFKSHHQFFYAQATFLSEKKLDTWVVDDVNVKITMTGEAFNEKFRPALKNAEAEKDVKTTEAAQQLKYKINNAENKLKQYENDYQYQLRRELYEFSKRSKSCCPEQSAALLKQIHAFENEKTRFAEHLSEKETELFNSLQQSKDEEDQRACNLLAYLKKIRDIKQGDVEELKKQVSPGLIRQIGSFINSHIIRELVNASFIFWICYFLVLCTTPAVAAILGLSLTMAGAYLLALAVLIPHLYLVGVWTTKIFKFLFQNVRETSDAEIKDALIRSQWLSVEPQHLTLEQKITKLNQLLALQEERVRLLQRKETWIGVDTILGGFVRGSFAPFFISWLFTTTASVIAFHFFGIAVLFSPFFLAGLTTAVLVCGISYGIYNAVNYYKADRAKLNELREQFHNKLRAQYNEVIDAFCEDLKKECFSVLKDDQVDLQDALCKKISEQRDRLINEAYSFLSSEKRKELLIDDCYQSCLQVFADRGEKMPDKLSASFVSKFQELRDIKLNPPKNSKKVQSIFWLVLKLGLIFLAGAGTGILFLKLLVVGVVLAWAPAAVLSVAVVGLLVLGGLLYAAWDVWKNYRLIDEQSKQETPVLFSWSEEKDAAPKQETVSDLPTLGEGETNISERNVTPATIPAEKRLYPRLSEMSLEVDEVNDGMMSCHTELQGETDKTPVIAQKRPMSTTSGLVSSGLFQPEADRSPQNSFGREMKVNVNIR